MSNWIPVTERLPDDRQDVIVGHSLGKWVLREHVRFIEGVFRIKHNAQRGGDAGFKQTDTTDMDGNPVGPDQWLWSASCNPTHWMQIPSHP